MLSLKYEDLSGSAGIGFEPRPRGDECARIPLASEASSPHINYREVVDHVEIAATNCPLAKFGEK